MAEIEQNRVKIASLRQEVAPLLEGNAQLQFFASDECLLRYLNARDMDVQRAARMLKQTLKWCVSIHIRLHCSLAHGHQRVSQAH
jgi:CRAL/TRIO, N-terminal domain